MDPARGAYDAPQTPNWLEPKFLQVQSISLLAHYTAFCCFLCLKLLMIFVYTIHSSDFIALFYVHGHYWLESEITLGFVLRCF